MARSDRVEAYGLTTGDLLWTWQPPDGEALAHASADAPDGVGVVLHHADGDGGAEHVRLTGLDARSDSVLWSREQRADARGSVDGHARGVALGGDRVATARPRHGDGSPVLRTFDARTGALLWERSVPERWGDVSVVRAHPVVVSTVRPSLIPRTASSWPNAPCPVTATGPASPRPGTASPWSARRSAPSTACACSAGNGMNPRPGPCRVFPCRTRGSTPGDTSNARDLWD